MGLFSKVLPRKLRNLFPFGLGIILIGCATLFGWDIHAPGILSEEYYQKVTPAPGRIGLYFPKDLLDYQSKNRGSKTADPQTYHVGEAYGPMLVEAFQNGFDEFVLLETKPTLEILKRYGINYLAVVQIKDFANRVTWRGQAVAIFTETLVFDANMSEAAKFETSGSSDAKRVFAKKGGPQVNLNAAIENNLISLVGYLQDSIRSGEWGEKAKP